MREIKFKAWDNFHKTMIQLETEHSEDYQNILSGRVGKQILPLQYTGLNDKNGVEIYEGDILRLVLDDEVAIVEFEKGQFICRWSSTGFKTPLYDLSWVQKNTVLGNIYENPELIGGS